MQHVNHRTSDEIHQLRARVKELEEDLETLFGYMSEDEDDETFLELRKKYPHYKCGDGW